MTDSELRSLLSKCEAALNCSSLSPSRQTLMTNRVAALRAVIELVNEVRETVWPGSRNHQLGETPSWAIRPGRFSARRCLISAGIAL